MCFILNPGLSPTLLWTTGKFLGNVHAKYFQENIVSSKSYFKIIPFKVSFSLDAKLLLISDTELLKKWWSWKEICVKWIFVVVQVELLWYLKKFLSMELVSHRWWQEHWKRNSRWDTCVFILLSNQVQGPYCKLLTKFFCAWIRGPNAKPTNQSGEKQHSVIYRTD